MISLYKLQHLAKYKQKNFQDTPQQQHPKKHNNVNL